MLNLVFKPLDTIVLIWFLMILYVVVEEWVIWGLCYVVVLLGPEGVASKYTSSRLKHIIGRKTSNSSFVSHVYSVKEPINNMLVYFFAMQAVLIDHCSLEVIKRLHANEKGNPLCRNKDNKYNRLVHNSMVFYRLSNIFAFSQGLVSLYHLYNIIPSIVLCQD